MSNIARIMQQAASGAAGGGPLAIEDVFSTYLYTGTSVNPNTITNGVDLAGEGGLVWIKTRTASFSHTLFDTERGINKYLSSDTTGAEGAGTSLTSFNSDGFTLGTTSILYNSSSYNYASWTFRKAPRFFDVVTYTGNGVAGRAISHNLGVAPGCMIVKYTSGSTSFPDWWVYHRGFATPETSRIRLNATDAVTTGTGSWGNTNPTDSVFYVGASGGVITNESGVTYVAYLFAHDPLGPSEDGSDGLIACGSYTGNGQGYVSGGNTVNVGWEPQWVMIFPATVSGYGATIFDNMRGMVEGNVPQDFYLQPSSAAAEASYSAYIAPTSTGFKLETSNGYVNESSQTYIYIAIRRGPMRAPTSGTEVFAPVQGDVNGKFVTGFPVDFGIAGRASTTDKWYWQSRLQGAFLLSSASTAAQVGSGSAKFDFMDGYGTGFTTAYYSTAFRRAPGFFDVVAYTGTGSARTISHNLGAVPELMIFKHRTSSSYDWPVYTSPVGATAAMFLNTTDVPASSSQFFNNTAPTTSVISLGTAAQLNISGGSHIAYLFASLPGISKVGSYTGNGSSQTINCAFTTGARFVLIKRTSGTGDWYVWDTARGIVAGNDPHLSLNTTAAEVTTNDSIDPDSSGFVVNQVAATNINVSSASYIYLAIA